MTLLIFMLALLIFMLLLLLLQITLLILVLTLLIVMLMLLMFKTTSIYNVYIYSSNMSLSNYLFPIWSTGTE